MTDEDQLKGRGWRISIPRPAEPRWRRANWPSSPPRAPARLTRPRPTQSWPPFAPSKPLSARRVALGVANTEAKALVIYRGRLQPRRARALVADVDAILRRAGREAGRRDLRQGNRVGGLRIHPHDAARPRRSPRSSISIGMALWMALSISKGLAGALGVATSIAEGDLSRDVTISGRDEITDLQRAFQAMVEKLREVVGQVNAAAENMSSGSQELSASAEQLSQGSTEQAASTEEASSSMEEMAANVRQNAENASTTEKIAAQSAKRRRSLGRGGRQGGRRHADHRAEDQHRAGDRPPDRSAGAERCGRGRPRRRARQGLRGGRLRSAQARRAQPGGRGRNRHALGRYGEGGAGGGRDAGQARPRHQEDRRAGRGDHLRQPRAGCRRQPDQPGDPAARQGHPAECGGVRAGLGHLRGAGRPGRAAAEHHRLLPSRRRKPPQRRPARRRPGGEAAARQGLGHVGRAEAEEKAQAPATSRPAKKIANGGFAFDLNDGGDQHDAAFQRS